MIQKVVTRRRLSESGKGDLAYWLSRPPSERIAAVEELRRQLYGRGQRIQKHVRIRKLGTH